MSEEIKFEKAIERLEKIVEELETGNIPLDEALKKYEEGVKLSRACQEKLIQTEKKIEILTRSLEGGLKKESFEYHEDKKEEGEGQTRKKGRSPSSQKGGREDEDLIL